MDRLDGVIKQYWGYDSLRPLQREAMAAAIGQQDSLVVLPTGGGKSLCYQAPALLMDGMTVVISPLIALMKDQVDRLLSRKIPAAFLNSSLEAEERRRVTAGVFHRRYRLLFVAPERFRDCRFIELLRRAQTVSFAIDEAHCISHWGHDFREDYRQLDLLKREFPTTAIHAFTATATQRVRDDIVAQLQLREPQVLVGDFFRPNLRYSAVPRKNIERQLLDELQRHPNQAGIIYCMRRRDVDEITLLLRQAGHAVAGYHAGMSDAERIEAQEAFADGKVNIIVATVAFGMGIDRSDIRFVLHAAMPKSIEHYQQETGRAGRDGQPAYCILFYSGRDFKLWQDLLNKENSPNLPDMLQMLEEMYRFCTGATCRHQRLVSYFGQAWNLDQCQACDLCTGTIASVDDSTVIAQKILSCVARTKERFGAGHVCDVLLGNATDKVMERRHNELSTFGLLADRQKPQLMRWIDQLADQNFLLRDGEYRVLKITAKGWQLLRSQVQAHLYASEATKARVTRKSVPKKRSRRQKTIKPTQESVPVPLDPVQQQRFDTLRTIRRSLADDESVPAYCVCSDRVLRAVVREQPATESELACIKGMGAARAERLAPHFLPIIHSWDG